MMLRDMTASRFEIGLTSVLPQISMRPLTLNQQNSPKCGRLGDRARSGRNANLRASRKRTSAPPRPGRYGAADADRKESSCYHADRVVHRTGKDCELLCH